jgi:Fe-S-cluster containining protein
VSRGASRVRLALYAEADALTARVQAASGLHCPSGCGVCCERHNPHVTVADLDPIAEALVAADVANAEAVHERAVAALAADAPCVFYQAGRLPGGCTQYELRPLLCRLFGYAAVRDKRGAAELAVCHVHKERLPDEAAAAAAYVARGEPVAMFADLQAQADAEDAARARERVPINAALVAALERALLRARFE